MVKLLGDNLGEYSYDHKQNHKGKDDQLYRDNIKNI